MDFDKKSFPFGSNSIIIGLVYIISAGPAEVNGMAEEKDFQEKQQEDTPFIREKIVKRPPSGREIARRICVGVLLAAVFGAAAGGAFAFFLNLGGGMEPETSTEIVWTDPVEPETTQAESSAQVSETEVQTSTEEEDLNSQISQIIESRLAQETLGVQDGLQIQSAVQKLVTQVEKSSVDLLVTMQGKDWFDQTYENKRDAVGFIVHKTDQEILLLASRKILENYVSLDAVFSDGTEVEAVLAAQDTLTGMAILSVSLNEVAPEISARLTELPLGSSAVQPGTPVIALGSPLGVSRSVGYTYISYIKKNKRLTDSSWTMIYTGMQTVAGSSGILINLNGELIGWLCDSYKESGMENLTAAVGITDIRYILQALCNQKPIPYLGIVGRDVTEEISEQQGIPVGVYLTTVEENSPAYAGNLQNGDVIVAIGNTPIENMKQLIGELNELSPGDKVVITAVRSGRDENRELQFPVTLMTR